MGHSTHGFLHLGDETSGIPRAIGDGSLCDCRGSFLRGSSEKLVAKEVDCSQDDAKGEDEDV